MTSPSPLAATTLATGLPGNALPAPSINAPLVADEKLVFGDQETAVSSGIVDASPEDVPPGKIMIVDDEVANVLVAKKLLSRAGHREFETLRICDRMEIPSTCGMLMSSKTTSG